MMTGGIRAVADGVFVPLKVQPRASRNEVVGFAGAELRVRVTAPPVDSAANQAVIELLAAHFDIGKNRVQLVKGKASRHKTVFLQGVDLAQLYAKK